MAIKPPPCPPCGAHVWRCTKCGNAVGDQRYRRGLGCPKCSDTTAADVTDGTCTNLCMVDATRCFRHGAKAPASKEAVVKRQRVRKAEIIVRRRALIEPTADADYLQVMQDYLNQCHTIVNTLTRLVNELDLEVSATDGEGASMRGIAGRTYHQSGIATGEASPHVFVTMLAYWSKELARHATECAKLNIEERRTQVVERIEQAQLDQLKGALTRATATLPKEVAGPFRKALAAELRPLQPPKVRSGP